MDVTVGNGDARHEINRRVVSVDPQYAVVDPWDNFADPAPYALLRLLDDIVRKLLDIGQAEFVQHLGKAPARLGIARHL